MSLVLYIHGFGSSGESRKAMKLRHYYEAMGVTFLAPTLSYIPELAVHTLEDIIEAFGHRNIKLMGASLGGFYATWLSQKYDLPAVLINPAMRMDLPKEALLGLHTHYFDGSRFEWIEAHFDMLRRYMDDLNALEKSRVLLLLQTGDDVIDYRGTLERFAGLPPSQIIVEEGGSHHFDGIETKCARMDAFLGLTD